MRHVLNGANHLQKLLVDLGVIFMTKLASNINVSHVLIHSGSKLKVDQHEHVQGKKWETNCGHGKGKHTARKMLAKNIREWGCEAWLSNVIAHDTELLQYWTWKVVKLALQDACDVRSHCEWNSSLTSMSHLPWINIVPSINLLYRLRTWSNSSWGSLKSLGSQSQCFATTHCTIFLKSEWNVPRSS